MLRATLKSLLSRKLRLLLSGLAVVLGVMAVSGALLVTDNIGRSFDALFSTISADLDVQIIGRQNVQVDRRQGGLPTTEPVPAAMVDTIAALPGVRTATGEVLGAGARVIGPDGKVVVSQGPPPFGVNWTGEGGVALIELRAGRGPTGPDEVAINAQLAKTTGYRVGDRIGILTLQPKRAFTVVGVFGHAGGRDSFGGESRVAFTEPVAQELMLGRAAVYTSISVHARDGVAQNRLRDYIAAAVGEGYRVRTGEQFAKEQAAGITEFLDTLRSMLLGFAAVSLFVGMFLILNTFSILVAQRTRELALLRALGASRGQVIRSVLVEAVATGLVAGTLGLAAGFGVAALLKLAMQALSGVKLPDVGFVVPANAVVAAYAVGVLVTGAAALLPALRAARIPPVAALREAATEDRPLTRLTIAGTAATVLGAGAVGAALFGHLGDATLMILLAGVLATFVGIAMLTPAITRPVASLLGRALSWSVPGRLGRHNSARNPRRTAITAAALMVGIALVTGVSVLADSLTASLKKPLTEDIRAELIITGGTGQDPGQATYDPAVIDKIRQVPGVTAAEPVYLDQVQAGTEAATAAVAAGGDVAALAALLNLKTISGQLRTLHPAEVVVDDAFAKTHGLTAGSVVMLATQRGGTRGYTVVGVYRQSYAAVGASLILSTPDTATGFRTPQAALGYVDLADDADPTAVRHAVDALLADNPEVTTVDRTTYAAQQAGQFNTFLVILYVLIGLAITIAVLGIVNTLALSVLERTRELGLIRAIGMRRAEVAAMVTVESVVIAVFGALLGLAVGSALGTAVVRALKDDGIAELSIPWQSLGTFLALAVLIGLVAAIIPAVRAARTDVLQAIAYE
jgi:putative ABC transport system permease protein